MSERAAYSRVYWSIIDDPKFEHVYDDDRALAAWLRLLLVADQAWPASAHLPGNIRRQAVALLVSSGLVDLQQGGRYRIHGLDAERTRRKEAATRPPNPTGTQQGPNRDPNGLGTTGLRRDEKETRQDEPSREDARAGKPRPPSPAQKVKAWLREHDIAQPVGWESSKVNELARAFGADAVVASFEEARSLGTAVTCKNYVRWAEQSLSPDASPRNGTGPRGHHGDAKEIADAFRA